MRYLMAGVLDGMYEGRPELGDRPMLGLVYVAHPSAFAKLATSGRRALLASMNHATVGVVGEQYPAFRGDARRAARTSLDGQRTLARSGDPNARAIAHKYVAVTTPGRHRVAGARRRAGAGNERGALAAPVHRGAPRPGRRLRNVQLGRARTFLPRPRAPCGSTRSRVLFVHVRSRRGWRAPARRWRTGARLWDNPPPQEASTHERSIRSFVLRLLFSLVLTTPGVRRPRLGCGGGDSPLADRRGELHDCGDERRERVRARELDRGRDPP